MEHTGLNGYVYDFSVVFGSVDVGDILSIYKYLVTKNNTKYCMGLSKNIYQIIN